MAMTTEGRQPIPPAKRRRLQQTFEHASKQVAQGQFDYASDLLTQCVLGDPGNAIYTSNFLNNLFRKYNNNKKGSKFAGIKGATTRGSIKKASMSKDWEAVIKSGLEMLKLNPWDVSALSAMAVACEELNFPECQLSYLKTALDANPKDADVNRLCGKALARMGHFDQAITCWHRVEQIKGGDEEAQRAIADLAVERTIHKGGYEGAESSTEVMANKAAQAERQGAGGVQLTPEQLLEKAIAKNPEEIANYIELSDLHLRADRYPEAEAVLAKALEASGGELNIRERLEDTQLRRARVQLQIAERQAEEKKTEDAVKLAKQMKSDLNKLELEVYRSRAERYPTNVGLKFELGLRLKRAGQFNDAIQLFQQARGDSKRKATVYLELGECFQHIKQAKLAMSNYEAAIDAVSERDADQRKLSLYRAGRLALSMAIGVGSADKAERNRHLDIAEKHLTALAGMEFGYRDVPDLLDKVGTMRNKD